jgi:hypothetical protein
MEKEGPLPRSQDPGTRSYCESEEFRWHNSNLVVSAPPKYPFFYLLKKAIRVTDLGGPSGCETPRLPHFLHNRLTDDDEVIILTRRPLFTPQENSWYSFLLEAESTLGS